ncbi:FtsK/SpoIIIE domain-containing protein [Isoptericola rhizosphaerae]|uniref:FtsK/SpoIIIE domain-containing protein n=1 Tax=Isoptericola rhizosphaerae TaxID=3377837 RepID=UPI00383AA6A8
MGAALFVVSAMAVGVLVCVGIASLVRKAAPRLLVAVRVHVFGIAWTVAVLVGFIAWPDYAILVLAAGIGGWVWLAVRGRRRRRARRSVANPRSDRGAVSAAEDPDVVVLATVGAAWAEACASVGLAVTDYRLTESLRRARSGQSSTAGGWAAVVEEASSALVRRTLMQSPGAVVQGRAVVATPLVLDGHSSPVGPVLVVSMLPGLTLGDYQVRTDALAHTLHVPGLSASQSESERAAGRVSIAIRLRDPLAAPVEVAEMPPADDLTAVPVALGEDGRWVTRSLANVSGEVIGGVPGSGKTAGVTAGVTSLLCRLAQNPCVQFVVIDGKGGSDLSWIEPRAAVWTNEDEDLASVRAVTEDVRTLLRQRLRTQMPERGASNFWDLPLVPEHPLIVVLVDEVQTFTDTRGMSKDAKAAAEAITANLVNCVKKGRSVGILVIVMTQKPTSDALPTSLRDNASIRTAFRVLTREAAVAVLGDAVNTAAVSPTEIARSTPGMAVVADESGDLMRVRFPYVSERVAADIARSTASMRRALTTEAGDGIETEGSGDVDHEDTTARRAF